MEYNMYKMSELANKLNGLIVQGNTSLEVRRNNCKTWLASLGLTLEAREVLKAECLKHGVLSSKSIDTIFYF